MEYLHFSRIYFTQMNNLGAASEYPHRTELPPNNMTNIQISRIAPYVDAIIIQNFQAGVYNRLIPQIKRLEIYTLKDIRIK